VATSHGIIRRKSPNVETVDGSLVNGEEEFEVVQFNHTAVTQHSGSTSPEEENVWVS
jgi:hypothetical protein